MAQRSKRILLVVLTAVFAFAGLGAWAFASPVGASPDDDYHLVSIWCSLGDREGLCAPGEADNQRVVSERIVGSSDCFAHDRPKSAQCPLDDHRMVSTDRGNFEGEYPPVFYSVMAIFASPNIAVSTILMRLFNAALFVGAVTAVVALLKPGQRGPIVWSAAVTLVPLGVFLIASVNPSSWAILAGLLVWVAAYGYFTAETRARRISLAAIAIVLAVMGAGARGDSAVYVAFAGLVAMILTFRKSRAWVKLALLPLGLITIGAFFFLTSGQATSTAVATVAQGPIVGEHPGGGGVVVTTGGSSLGSIFNNFIDLPWFLTGGTGTWELGWFDTPLAKAVGVLMIGMLFTLVIWGLRATSLRKGLVLVIALSALVVIPLYVLHGKGARVGEWVQPRYIMPLLIIFVGVALFGFARDHLGLSRLQAAVVFASIAFANSLSLQSNMRRYITGIDVAGFNLNTNIEWWWDIPVSPMLVWFIGSAAFALMLLSLWLWLYPKGERPGVPEAERSPELIRG